MESNLINFNAFVEEKDLKEFCQALFTRVNKLELENEKLREKVDHLEYLLTNMKEVPELTRL